MSIAMRAIWTLVVLVVGFMAGVYALPILTAPKAHPAAEVDALAKAAVFHGEFRRNLKGSDAFHWGEGRVSVSPRTVSLVGKLAPGPDYKLYLSPEFVETEEHFQRIKAQSVRLGDVKSFENFVVAVPATVDVMQFTTAVVWCESFSQFISAAEYRHPGSAPAAGATLGNMFLVVYQPGPSFRNGKPLREQDLKEHGRYMLDLYAQGALLSAGPFLDESGGAVILTAPDHAAATAITENDPAVHAGIFVYQLYPWRQQDWAQHLKRRYE